MDEIHNICKQVARYFTVSLLKINTQTIEKERSYLYLCKTLLFHLSNKLICEIHFFTTIYAFFTEVSKYVGCLGVYLFFLLCFSNSSFNSGEKKKKMKTHETVAISYCEILSHILGSRFVDQLF